MFLKRFLAMTAALVGIVLLCAALYSATNMNGRNNSELLNAFILPIGLLIASGWYLARTSQRATSQRAAEALERMERKLPK